MVQHAEMNLQAFQNIFNLEFSIKHKLFENGNRNIILKALNRKLQSLLGPFGILHLSLTQIFYIILKREKYFKMEMHVPVWSILHVAPQMMLYYLTQRSPCVHNEH